MTTTGILFLIISPAMAADATRSTILPVISVTFLHISTAFRPSRSFRYVSPPFLSRFVRPLPRRCCSLRLYFYFTTLLAISQQI